MTQKPISTTQDEDRIMSSIYQNFSRGNTVLFVGRGASEADLPMELCEMRWSCIVTDRTEEGFGARFATDVRRPKEYCSASELPQSLFDKDNLAVIRLYGIEGLKDDLDDDDPEMAVQRRNTSCQEMLSIVLKKLGILGMMVVCGYDPTDATLALPRTVLSLACEKCQGTIFYLGMSSEATQMEKLKEFAIRRGDEWCETSLAELLGKCEVKEADAETAGETLTSASEKNTFWLGGKMTPISTSITLRYRNLAELLTNERIYQNRPYGRIQQSRWFFNFLTRSSVDGPQWYGYLPQSEFYLKRSYEKTLVSLIHNILTGREMAEQGYSTPVILEGDPGSSKSIILGALAFKVFTEKDFPVIFIRNTELNRQDLEELDQMMQAIVPEGESASKVLVIWDGSAYYNVTKTALDIARYLDNNGRRFVLVCSSYRNTGIDQDDHEPYSWYRLGKEEHFIPCGKSDASVALKRGCYFVEAVRELSESEIVQLKQKVKLYSGKNTDALKEIWKRLDQEGVSNSFEYFYQLIILLQPKLEQGLSREQRKVSRYVQEQLDKARADGIDSFDREPGTMALALREAGILDPELELELEKEEQREEEQDGCDLTRFNIGIALFSRFKLEAPSGLMFWLLYGGMQSEEISFYSYKNRKLFAEVTTAIPWILYREGTDGNYYFSYRITLEAEIFLRKNQVEPETIIELVCDMLDYYAQDYEQCGGIENPEMKQQLLRLLRTLGPNSDYGQFRNPEDIEHNRILGLFDKIIHKLEWLRTKENSLPDKDAGFAAMEVTFTREYYSSRLWNQLNNGDMTDDGFCSSDMHPEKYTEQAYLERLDKLKKASDLANASIEKLEESDQNPSSKRQKSSQINSLTVEFVYCNMKYDELQKEYHELRNFHLRMKQGANEIEKNKEQENEKEDKSTGRISYLTQYRMLIRAINSDPLNGYAYNALFSLFEKEYEGASEEEKLQLLSEIQVFVEDAENLDIHNRGALDQDELSQHIVKIYHYRSATNVTIQSILDGSCQPVFLNLFDDMLSNNSPAAIMFVCQQELDRVNLNGNRGTKAVSIKNFNSKDSGFINEDWEETVLDDTQLQTCENILSFMKKKEYASCIEKDPHALYLLLRVTWMCYNRHPLVDRGECRLTYIQQEKWKEILRICQMYEDCAGENKRPLAILIYALAVVQVKNDYVEANALLESLGRTSFYASPRLRVPYMICEPSGIPRSYRGTVISVKDFKGFIKVENIPQYLGSKTGIRFYSKNLRLSKAPEEKQVITSLEMGIGYTGFSLYTEEGRKKRMEEKR